MKMRKLLIAGCCLLMAGCSVKTKDFGGAMREEFGVEVEKERTKTAILLPLTGESAQLGNSFRNAILMAQLDRDTDEATEVVFFDSKGTAMGARESYLEAKKADADVILGPVFSTEVSEISSMNPSIPVISFTSDSSVLKEGIYSMALLLDQQVQHIVSFACQNGQEKIALLGPKNKTGSIVVQSFEKAIQSCPNMRISHISMYEDKNPDLTGAVSKIAPPLIDLKKNDLTEEEKELALHPTAERIEFDALFVFEQGVRLQQLVSLLGYYDVTPNLVPFYGLATLRAQHNRDLIGAYFADLPQERLNLYKQNYQDAFSEKPIMVSALGYDGISLISYLSKKDALNERGLLSEDGFFGINGRFKFNEDGTNARLLEMYQIRGKNRIVKVSPALQSFNY